MDCLAYHAMLFYTIICQAGLPKPLSYKRFWAFNVQNTETQEGQMSIVNAKKCKNAKSIIKCERDNPLFAFIFS